MTTAIVLMMAASLYLFGVLTGQVMALAILWFGDKKDKK